MIVVDNSVLVPAVIPGERSVKAKRAAARDARWILPPLWKFEFTNTVATFARSGALSYEGARDALGDAHALVMAREVPVDQRHVLRLAVSLSVSGYDAQYLALAELFGVRCVTDDRQMARRAPALAVLLDEFSE